MTFTGKKTVIQLILVSLLSMSAAWADLNSPRKSAAKLSKGTPAVVNYFDTSTRANSATFPIFAPGRSVYCEAHLKQVSDQARPISRNSMRMSYSGIIEGNKLVFNVFNDSAIDSVSCDAGGVPESLSQEQLKKKWQGWVDLKLEEFEHRLSAGEKDPSKADRLDKGGTAMIPPQEDGKHLPPIEAVGGRSD